MNKLNEAQQLAVDCNDKHILCIAGAGTGKTHTLISRMVRICKTESSDSILALTFTNAAAKEMRDRFRDSCRSSSTPDICTFHAFCYKLICENVQILTKIGYNDIPDIITDVEYYNIWNKIKVQLDIKLSDNKLKDVTLLNSKDKFVAELFYKTLRKSLKQINKITFDILIESVTDLFINDDECIQQYKHKYRYILVDEFQDTDPLQWEFVETFLDSNIFLCGDALQAIYGFRGADSSIIKDLATNSDYTVIKLYENYRSDKSICDFANKNTHHASNAYRLELKNVSKEKGHTELHSIDMVPYSRCIDNDALDYVVASISKLNGVSAILARTNKEVVEIQEYLRDLNVLNHNVNIDYCKHLIKSINLDYAIDYCTSLLNNVDYSLYIKQTCESNREDCFSWLYFRHHNNHIRKFLTTRNKLIHIITSRDTKYHKILDVCDLLNIPIQHTLPSVDDIETINDFKKYMLNFLDTLQNDNIYIGTIHSVKGLEFDNVFLYGVNSFSFKLKSEENKNLYYVGITRAKHNLYVFRED